MVSDTPTDSLNRLFLEQSKRANFLNAYLAGSIFADAMLGRVMEALEAYPEMYNNTIVVVFGDHGFSLSENGIGKNRPSGKPMSELPCSLQTFVIRNPQ